MPNRLAVTAPAYATTYVTLWVVPPNEHSSPFNLCNVSFMHVTDEVLLLRYYNIDTYCHYGFAP